MSFPVGFEKTVGSIAIRFSLLEFVIQVTILHLTSSDMTLYLLAGDSYGILVKKLENIIIYKLHKKNLLTEELKKEVLDLTEYLGKKGTRRNEIIHSFWNTDKNGKIVSSRLLRRTKDNKITESNRPDNLKSLENFAEDLMSASQKVIAFRNKIDGILLNNNKPTPIPETIKKLLGY